MATGYRSDLRELPPEEIAPVVSWDDFLTYEFSWSQGDHVGLIGPTGTGKTTLTYNILPIRKYVVFLATKPRDDTLEKFAKKAGFVRIGEYPPIKGRLVKRPYTAAEMPRRLLWPDASTLQSAVRQKDVFTRAVSQVYREGNWCLVMDEFWMITRILKMEDEARILLQQARSNGISLVLGTQRPSRIPLEVFDQSTHLFFAKDNDERNLNRISGVGWLKAGDIRAFAANLDPHQFLYVNTRTGRMVRTTCPPA